MKLMAYLFIFTFIAEILILIFTFTFPKLVFGNYSYENMIGRLFILAIFSSFIFMFNIIALIIYAKWLVNDNLSTRSILRIAVIF